MQPLLRDMEAYIGGATPGPVAQTAAVVCIMAANTAALHVVMSGPDGVLTGLRPETVVVDISTVSPTASRALAAQVAARGEQMLACSEGVLLAEKKGEAYVHKRHWCS